jgi:hypothetical protein
VNNLKGKNMKLNTTLKTISTAFAVSLLGACASQAPAPQAEQLPDWVLTPIIENGIADTQCVNATADFNVLKNKATALGRAELTKQISIKVKAMDKTYQRLTDTNEGSSTGGTFESVSKQLANKTLSGSRATKVNYINFPDNTQKLCVMVTMSPELTESLFKDLVKESGRNVSPDNEAVLYERFLAKKASDEMDAEFKAQN